MMMDSTEHSIGTLFEQLGLDGDEASIERFVDAHRPLDPAVPLAEAPFWSDSQAAFLRESLERDGAWALPVDELDARLR